MKTFDNKQLAATRSMSELQATKRQITRRLRRTERHMADQYREATEMFSLRTVLTYGISASIVVGLVYWAAKEWLL